MNTSQLKVFAQEARSILLEGVGLKMQYWGFNEKGEVTEEPQPVSGGVIFRGTPIDDPTIYSKWKALKEAVSKRGVHDVIEEATYTWFNRFMAIRILSKNGYESPQVEYTSEESKVPQILTRARRGQYGFLTTEETKQLDDVITDYSRENEAFGILIKGYCHSHPLISQVFGNLDDFTELLLPDNILSDSGFIHLLNTTAAITDEDYQQVELIGWLYQFYISERKDEVFAAFKKNKKAEAADIPAATQIFTPNWIVKYMVQNTVGKLYLDLRPDSSVKQNLKYLVENESAVAVPIIKEAADIKLLDPAVGSGHILVEGFDILYECFMEEYYTPEEAVKTILTKSLYGLDLDKRAMQLARFAVLLKAAKQHPEIIQQPIMPRIYAMPEGVHFSRQEILDFLGEDLTDLEKPLTEALKLMYDARNLGSIMQFELEEEDREKILQRWKELKESGFRSMNEETVMVKMRPYLEVLGVLTQQYESVVANPPYLGYKFYNQGLKNYLETFYPSTATDLFAVFQELISNLGVEGAMRSIVNQWAWMCIDTYTDFRERFVNEYQIVSLLHLGIGVFKELNTKKVQNVSLVFSDLLGDPVDSLCFKLDEVFDNEIKEQQFLTKSYIHQKNFELLGNIPNTPLAFWFDNDLVEKYSCNRLLNDVITPRVGLQTGDNDQFVRLWYEVSMTNLKEEASNREEALDSGKKWFPYNKGGGYNKWYGNNYFVVNWGEDGRDIKSTKPKSVIRNESYYFREGISWSLISLNFSARYTSTGYLFDVGGSSGFPVKEDLFYSLALLNSKVSSYLLKGLNFTLNVQVGDIKRILFIDPEDEDKNLIDRIAKKLVELSKYEFDSFELSRDFKGHPLFRYNNLALRSNFVEYLSRVKSDIQNFFDLETKINNVMMRIYSVKMDLKPELDYLTLYRDYTESLEIDGNELKVEIDSSEFIIDLISYCIGCWMGRYRLDKPGLHIAHPNPSEEEVAPYTINSPLHEVTDQVTVNIREDAIIPSMGKSGSFPQDAANLVPQFIQYIWGEETFTENINFLEECLDKDLEKYLIRDFWKDHCRRYKKRPIYWLFSSEKGAFQVLVYMHRMNRFTVEKIRSEYLLPHMKYLQTQIDLLTRTGQDPKNLDRMIKNLEECEAYDLVLKDKADQQIEFDLDDGVVENYKLFEGVVAKIV